MSPEAILERLMESPKVKLNALSADQGVYSGSQAH